MVYYWAHDLAAWKAYKGDVEKVDEWEFLKAETMVVYLG